MTSICGAVAAITSISSSVLRRRVQTCNRRSLSIQIQTILGDPVRAEKHGIQGVANRQPMSTIRISATTVIAVMMDKRLAFMPDSAVPATIGHRMELGNAGICKTKSARLPDIFTATVYRPGNLAHARTACDRRRIECFIGPLQFAMRWACTHGTRDERAGV